MSASNDNGRNPFALQPRVIRADGGQVAALALLNGNELLIGETNGRLERWDMNTCLRMKRWSCPDEPYAVAASPDGKFVGAGGKDGWLQIRETQSWKLVLEDCLDLETSCLRFSPDGKALACGTVDAMGHGCLRPLAPGFFDAELPVFGDLSIYPSGEWHRKRTLFDGRGRVAGVTFSPDSKWIAAWVAELGLFVWETGTRELIHQLPDPEAGPPPYRPCPIQFSPDGMILAASVRSRINFWHTSDWRLPAELTPAGGAAEMMFGADAREHRCERKGRTAVDLGLAEWRHGSESDWSYRGRDTPRIQPGPSAACYRGHQWMHDFVARIILMLPCKRAHWKLSPRGS